MRQLDHEPTGVGARGRCFTAWPHASQDRSPSRGAGPSHKSPSFRGYANLTNLLQGLGLAGSVVHCYPVFPECRGRALLSSVWANGRRISRVFIKLARPERFELPTNWFEASYSIQLSYGRTRGRLYRFLAFAEEPMLTNHSLLGAQPDTGSALCKNRGHPSANIALILLTITRHCQVYFKKPWGRKPRCQETKPTPALSRRHSQRARR